MSIRHFDSRATSQPSTSERLATHGVILVIALTAVAVGSLIQ